MMERTWKTRILRLSEEKALPFRILFGTLVMMLWISLQSLSTVQENIRRGCFRKALQCELKVGRMPIEKKALPEGAECIDTSVEDGTHIH